MFLEEDKKFKIILASGSPRRVKILQLLKIDFEVIPPSDFQEAVYENPYEMAIINSIKKSKNVADYVRINKSNLMNEGNSIGFFVCGLDTIVLLNNKIFLKPKSIEEARGFLNELSGNTHKVITGISLMNFLDNKLVSDYEETKVTFRRLSINDIESYLEKENLSVLDKAGAYNIEGYGAVLVKKINGCFYNVMGLPIFKFIQLLKSFNLKLQDFQK